MLSIDIFLIHLKQVDDATKTQEEEMTLEESGNPILIRKQRVNLYSC